jgi:hypothetical protein
MWYGNSTIFKAVRASAAVHVMKPVVTKLTIGDMAAIAASLNP